MLKKILLGLGALVLVTAAGVYWYVDRTMLKDPFAPLFAAECAGCHGAAMQGTHDGPALAADGFILGSGVRQLERLIAEHPPLGSPTRPLIELQDAQIRGLAILIGEMATDRVYRTFEVEEALEIPEGEVASMLHGFRVEVITSGLHRWPFGMAPLPDGGFVITEKTQGLRLVSATGEVSELIKGTPPVSDETLEVFLPIGHGWMLDVALHPQYVDNGWVYLHYTERCEDCSGPTKSRNTVVRGRINDGRWMDQELVWQPDATFFSRMPDIAAGGRLAFDDAGHLFISVGLKGTNNFDGCQDLGSPAGKIHRVNADGSVPLDNPFTTIPGAMHSVWTYGHRSPQGLEFDAETGELWEAEMGPRGGDEVNLLLPGRNYGWPLTSRGVDYDGTHVEYGNELNIEFDLADIEQPRVDLTPAPAVSSFTIYRGNAFPGWQGHLLVGSLAARELYRVNRGTGKVEKLLANIGRIRDVAVGADGLPYLLLEHPSGGRLVRLVPVEPHRLSMR